GNLDSFAADGNAVEQELQALKRIKDVRHPFVLSLERIEIVEGELAIVTELADKNLQDVFEERRAGGMTGIPVLELLCYMHDAAEALDHMYQKHRLQHLDIKPRNLFVIAGRVKVADFGVVTSLERPGAAGIGGG